MRFPLLARSASAFLIVLASATSGVAAAVPAASAGVRYRPTAAARSGHRPLTFVSSPRTPQLPAGQEAACPVPSRPGQMQCLSILPAVRRAGKGITPAATKASGYGPADLRSAYRLAAAAATRGAGQTVAIVDAESDPKAAADLAVYRRSYGLPACTTANRCLRIVNQDGKTGPLPVPDPGWAVEISLDLDMVSAVCPRCKILLVEANTPLADDLGTAENTAVALGARFVTNSWGSGDFIGEQTYDHYFNHPGVAITFAAGDLGYGPSYPADTQYVTAIGGTSLSKAKNSRGWTESVWGANALGTGSGCSSVEAKAPWQTADNSFPDGCLNRTANDVAAVADPAHGVAVYDSYTVPYTPTCGGWCPQGVGGTSAAAPIIAAVYALAGTPVPGTYPASYPYQHPARFFDITTGSNSIGGPGGTTCETRRAYLCNGEPGYDGPTGLGTPDGIAGFASGGGQRVTLLDPGAQGQLEGTAFSLRISGHDTNRAATSLSYAAAGLPPGLTIAPVPGSLDAMITGTLPASPGGSLVTVTATDTATGKTGRTSFRIVTSAQMNTATFPAGQMPLWAADLCLNDPGTHGGQASVVTCDPAAAGQSFSLRPGAAPAAADTLVAAGTGRCLAEAGAADQSAAILQACDGSAAQQWIPGSNGVMASAASGLCLGTRAGRTVSGTPVEVDDCVLGYSGSWTLPPALITSGDGGCLTAGTPGGPVTVTACTGVMDQRWTSRSDGLLTIATSSGVYCLGDGHAADSGRALTLELCSSASNVDLGQEWFPGPSGEFRNSWQKCLYYPGGTAAVVQQDCYGLSGQTWSTI